MYGHYPTAQRNAYQNITKEVTCLKDWTDEDGNVHPEEMGLTLTSFRRMNKEYMLLGCTQDAAEVQKEYLQYGIRLPTGCPLKVFYNRLMQINSYFVLLPCLKDTKLAPEDMPRANKELTNFELTTVLLRAVPQGWANSYELIHPVIPVDSKTSKTLREDLEVVEKSENSKRKLEEKKESSREKKKKAKDASPKGGNSKDSRNPNGKHCSLCAKHGGPHKTHDTAACLKWNSDGSRKSKPNDNKWGRKLHSDGLTELKQEGLIDRITEALGLQDAANKFTPAEGTSLVRDTDGEAFPGTFNYANIYLAGHSRPDIAYAVNCAARYMFSPRAIHEKAVKRIGRYLKAT